MTSKKKQLHCSYCNFFTTNKTNWKQHLMTVKHANNVGNTSIKPIKSQKNPNIGHVQNAIIWNVCEICGKKYRYKSGLSRHKKKCVEISEEPEQSIAISTYNQDKTSLLENHQQQISDLKSLLEKTIEKQQDTINQLIPKVGNTTNYNKMTVNVFLNEKCKNAMNLTDFVEQLHLSFDDVMYTRDNGYIKGITNIFMKNLIGMEPTNRPIHCSDQKQLSFFVKDENQWEQDNEHSKIDSSIEKITRKQIQQIKEWEAQHPNWAHSEEETNMYMEIVKESIGGMNEVEKHKNLETIKKELGVSFDLNKIINK